MFLATVVKCLISVYWFCNKRKIEWGSCVLKLLIQTWSHGFDNDVNSYCSYSGNTHVVILQEIIFWSHNRELF